MVEGQESGRVESEAELVAIGSSPMFPELVFMEASSPIDWDEVIGCWVHRYAKI